MNTFFAPAERAGEGELKKLVHLLRESPLLKAIEESIDGYLMILNPQRQVLAVNDQLLELLQIDDSEGLLGHRPGEVVECTHSNEGPGGCGTSRACSTCGAVISILESQNKGQPSSNECLINVRKNGGIVSFEFRVRSTPVSVGNEIFTVLVFHDISGEKRRQALERIFFHDILNTVGGLMGYSSLLGHIDGMDPAQIAEKIVTLSKKLNLEIQDQRRITLAEEGILKLEITQQSLKKVLLTVHANFEAHEALKDRYLDVEIPSQTEETVIETDGALLGRVLTNMVKNALEAVSAGETVRVWAETENEQVVFYVHNPGKIADEIALQIFKRSFSTKAAKGRGLGTYSMKLFGETYLHGAVGFETSDEGGTVFYLKVPLRHSEKKPNTN